MALPLVQKGKFSAGTALLVSTLKNVDFLFGANRVDDEVEVSQADSPDIRQTDDANLERRAKAAEQDALLLFFLLRRHVRSGSSKRRHVPLFRSSNSRHERAKGDLLDSSAAL